MYMLSYVLFSRGLLRPTALHGRVKPGLYSQWFAGFFGSYDSLTYVVSISLFVDLVEGEVDRPGTEPGSPYIY